MPTMPRKLPPYVQAERTRHGKVVFYYRRSNGPRIRLPAPTEPGFGAAYAAAMGGARIPASKARSGTLAWLIDAYKRSAHWANLKPSTRRMRDNILQRVAREAGAVPFAAITRKHINEAIDRRPPHAGNTFRKVMSQMFAWAVSVDLVERSPVEGANRHKVKSNGHHVWTLDEVRKFHDRHPIGTKPLDDSAPKDRVLIGVERPPYEDKTHYNRIQWREDTQRWMVEAGVDWSVSPGKRIWAYSGANHYLDPLELPGLPYWEGDDEDGDDVEQ